MTTRRKTKTGVKARFVFWFLALLLIWLGAMIAAAYLLLPRPDPAKTALRHITPADLARELENKTLARLEAPPLRGRGRIIPDPPLDPQAPPRRLPRGLRWEGESSTDLILAEQTIRDFWAEAPRLQVEVIYPEFPREGEKIRLSAGFEDQPLIEILIFEKPGRDGKTGDSSTPQFRPLRAGEPPLIAIVIDDIGNDLAALDRLLTLPVPVTFAVLPYAPHAQAACQRISRAGAQALLHMPMEPESYPDKDPGPGALLTALGPDEIVGRLERALARTPCAIGVNNHMGSAFTVDARAMEPFLLALKKQGLFFLDSRTSVNTVGLALARRLGVRSVERRVFLDHEPSPAYIRGKLAELAELADREGVAVGIGHPYPETVAVLLETLPEMARAGYRFVFVSEVVQ